MDHSEVKHLPKVDHTPADLDKASRLLLHAASRIEERGHCQNGNGLDEQGRMCVMVALGGSPQRDWSVIKEAELRLENALPAHVPGSRSLRKIARWSDGTPTADVIAKLRAVALGL